MADTTKKRDKGATAENSGKIPGLRAKGAPRGKPMPENVKPYQFPPGQSGNPGGRPKSPITDALKMVGSLPAATNLDELSMEGMSLWQQLAVTAFALARKGDMRAWIAVTDRVEGKPLQAIEDRTPVLTHEERQRRIDELLTERKQVVNGVTN